jgi:hypothetical protein
MKYTLNNKQATSVGGVTLAPGMGTMTEAEYQAVIRDRWGQTLIEQGILKVDSSAAKPAKA